LRKARGLTLTELSVMLGRSDGWLSQVERGTTQLSISNLLTKPGRLPQTVAEPKLLPNFP